MLTQISNFFASSGLVRNRTGIPNAPILQDETLRSSNPKNSGSTTSTPLGPSLKFGFASFDTTTSAAAFLQHIKSHYGKNSLDLNPEPKIEIANPPETFVRLDPTDKSETENLKYGWNGIGKRGWDGISNGFGNEITKWCLKDDRIGADVWSKEDKVGFEKSESSNPGTKEKAIPRAKGWEIEDDEDKIVGDGEKNEKSVSDSRKGSEESASRKRQRVEGEFKLEDSNSDLKNQISERSKKVPQLAGSKKVSLTQSASHLIFEVSDRNLLSFIRLLWKSQSGKRNRWNFIKIQLIQSLWLIRLLQLFRIQTHQSRFQPSFQPITIFQTWKS